MNNRTHEKKRTFAAKAASAARAASIAASLALCGCASGVAIVTGAARPPSAASSVRLLTETPARYETIGIVKASSSAGWTEQGSYDYAVEELKKQAARIGANAVLLDGFGATETAGMIGVSGPAGMMFADMVGKPTLMGKAIFVSD